MNKFFRKQIQKPVVLGLIITTLIVLIVFTVKPFGIFSSVTPETEQETDTSVEDEQEQEQEQEPESETDTEPEPKPKSESNDFVEPYNIW